MIANGTMENLPRTAGVRSGMTLFSHNIAAFLRRIPARAGYDRRSQPGCITRYRQYPPRSALAAITGSWRRLSSAISAALRGEKMRVRSAGATRFAFTSSVKER